MANVFLTQRSGMPNMTNLDEEEVEDLFSYLPGSKPKMKPHHHIIASI